MDNIRTYGKPEESGIALVAALVLTLSILMLIAGVSHLFTRGLKASIINKEFTTVYDAANGGVEHAVGIITSHWTGRSLTGLGKFPEDITSVLYCSSTTDTGVITTYSADKKYRIEMTIKCLGKHAIPGAGGALAFPPPKGLSGGGTAAWYIFYSITATAEEQDSPAHKGRTEAVFRMPA